MATDFDWRDPLALDISYGYLARNVAAPKRNNPALVLNNESGSMLRVLREELAHSRAFTFSVAFVSPRAIALLKQELLEFEGEGRIITSDYLGFNSPQAFYELENLRSKGIDVRLHEAEAFHPKGYVFDHGDRFTAIVGSSNLTENALVKNHEWNLKVSSSTESDLTSQLVDLLDQQMLKSVPLTTEWIEEYGKSYVPPSRRSSPVHPTVEPAGPALVPVAKPRVEANAMQREALLAIDGMRQTGKQRVLVISATGTGKTILSALDVRRAQPERMLFVVHREQIIDRAITEFQRVLGAPASDFGKLTGGSKQGDRRYVFATVQTLSQRSVLDQIDPRAFDYILIDEVHRAGADSYARVLEHFRPAFMLGMTATPERTDGFNIFELFGYNVAYEIRLNQALENDMLSPFHYYGVADITFDDGSTTEDATSLSRLVSSERAQHIVKALDAYGQAGVPPRGLIFCSRTAEAQELAIELGQQSLRGRRIRCAALTGSDSVEQRQHAVDQLERGELDYLLTVDIFNEGVDIPSVNQVIMLRQTQSAIVFVQQLGRGLRKHPGKEYLVVIDFIGNYANNYLIPIALFGDDSLNKESLKKNLIAAEEIGVIAGLSSVRFDRVSQERVLRSIATTSLDSMVRLKSALELLRNRLGRVPLLADFLRFDSADPVVVATRCGNYPELVRRALHVDHGLTTEQLDALSLLSSEALAAKRPYELAIVRQLLHRGPLSEADLLDAVRTPLADTTLTDLESALRVLTLEFHTQAEKARYKRGIVSQDADGRWGLTAGFRGAYSESARFAEAVDDLLSTGLELIRREYPGRGPFAPGRQYSRKDACRLLDWEQNVYSTIYGYKVDYSTSTCPIFVTYHKSDEISASTAYEDELLDPSTMLWYTRSRRTLASQEVAAIASNSVDIHVFAKKDDAEGTDFYYLGRATARDAEQTTMPGEKGENLSVVRMMLDFDVPISAPIFDYFQPSITR